MTIKSSPCSSGSALKDIGVIEFFEKLDVLTETSYDDDSDFAAQVYKIRHDDSGNRVTFLKSLSGTLSVRDEVNYGDYFGESYTNPRL